MAEQVEELSLKDQLKHALEEARIVVPGIQALFGFQLIAVFNTRFDQDLSSSEQYLHLGATALSALAIALALAPASLHRQTEPGQVSQRLVKCSTAFLTASFVPLTFGVTADFYILSRLILKDGSLSLWFTLALLAIFVLLWFVYPQVQRRRAALRG